MGDKSRIGWTDSTWNPVVGCSRVSEACRYCYAESLSHRFGWTSKPWTGPNAAVNVQLHPERLDQPIRWQKPRRIFVNSMSDLFHEEVPDGFIDDVFAVMAMAARHTYQILTKRPQRMRNYLRSPETVFRIAAAIDRRDNQQGYDVLAQDMREGGAWPLRDVWLGVSVEDQRRANERIPLLLQTPADVRFLSCEPLLGPIDLTALPYPTPQGDTVAVNALCRVSAFAPTIDWVITGAESGSHARPMDDDWVRALRDQCQASGTAFFFKQRVSTDGRKDTEPFLDGRQWLEFPEGAMPHA